jgi:hypothetical protein
VIAEIESGAAEPSLATQQLVANERDSSPPPAATPEPAGKRVDLGYDRQGREIPVGNEHGLPAEIAREMHASADGYDAQLATMQASAAKVLQEMPPTSRRISTRSRRVSDEGISGAAQLRTWVSTISSIRSSRR